MITHASTVPRGQRLTSFPAPAVHPGNSEEERQVRGASASSKSLQTLPGERFGVNHAPLVHPWLSPLFSNVNNETHPDFQITGEGEQGFERPLGTPKSEVTLNRVCD